MPPARVHGDGPGVLDFDELVDIVREEAVNCARKTAPSEFRKSNARFAEDY